LSKKSTKVFTGIVLFRGVYNIQRRGNKKTRAQFYPTRAEPQLECQKELPSPEKFLNMPLI